MILAFGNGLLKSPLRPPFERAERGVFLSVPCSKKEMQGNMVAFFKKLKWFEFINLLPISSPLLFQAPIGSVIPANLDAEKSNSSSGRGPMFPWRHTKPLAKYVPGGR